MGGGGAEGDGPAERIYRPYSSMFSSSPKYKAYGMLTLISNPASKFYHVTLLASGKGKDCYTNLL